MEKALDFEKMERLLCMPLGDVLDMILDKGDTLEVICPLDSDTKFRLTVKVEEVE